MKTQIFQNWFKLMLGTSALIISVSFLIRSITPVYANNPSPSNVAGTNGYVEGGYVYFFLSDGRALKIKVGQMENFWKYYSKSDGYDLRFDITNDGYNDYVYYKGLGKPITYSAHNGASDWRSVKYGKETQSAIIQWWDWKGF